MSEYRNPVDSLHAENAKLRAAVAAADAKIVELETKSAPKNMRAVSFAHFGFGMLLIVSAVLTRTLGVKAEIATAVILVAYWAFIVRTLRN